MVILVLVSAMLQPRDAQAGIGGGFTNAGLTGSYFANPSWSGRASFKRKDVRLDFGTGNIVSPAGVGQTGEPGYSDVGVSNWSAEWTGAVIARFNETYTISIATGDAATVEMRPPGAINWTRIVSLTRAGNGSGKLAMVSGKPYDIRVDMTQRNPSWGLTLRWSSPSTPDEVIDPLADIGLNNPDQTVMFADIVKCARNTWLDAGMDANGWPTGDGRYVFQESLNQGLDIDPLMTGRITFRFKGRANVAVQGNCDSLSYHFNAATDSTTGSFLGRPKHWNASTIAFSNSHRDSSATGRGGITDFELMRPAAPYASTSYASNAVFTTQMRNAVSHYTLLRFQLVANQQVNWSDRTLPSFFNQNGGSTAAPHYGNGSTSDNGMAWEYKVMLCNETGRDLMISVPTVASGVSPMDTTSYVYRLANLIRYGSDGVDPYTQPTTRPMFAPLNPNLHVYLELENELWNYASVFYTDYANVNSLVAADRASNDADFQALNYDGVNDKNVWRVRKAIQRVIEISGIFRAVFGNGALTDRIRPVYEWQYDNANGTASTALEFADNYYDNGDGRHHVPRPHPVSYYLWGGGGATYYGAVNPEGLSSLLVDSDFAVPALAEPGYHVAPAAGPWSFAGTAGIARWAPGDTGGIPPPWRGAQEGYITDTGSAVVVVHFPPRSMSSTYAVSFKAVNRTHNGASPDQETIRVYLDAKTDITAKTFSQGDGCKPASYLASNAWYANNVPWTQSDYYFTRSFNAAPGSVHTITIQGVGDPSNPKRNNQTVFLGSVQVTSAGAIFDSGMPGGGEANGQPPGEVYQRVLDTEADWAATFGLHELSYEGGWSLGGDDGGSWIQLVAKYGDRRAAAAELASLSMFHAAGSTVSVLGTYSQWPSWPEYYAHQGFLDVSKYPLVEAVDANLDRLSTLAKNGALAPTRFSIRNPTLSAGLAGGVLTSPGWVSWNAILPISVRWIAGVTTTGGGTAELVVDDANVIGKATGGPISGSLFLTRGLHTVKIKAIEGSVKVVGASIIESLGPASPLLLSAAEQDKGVRLTWTSTPGAAGYAIYYGAGTNQLGSTVSVTGVSTSTLINGLTDGQEYYFVVRARAGRYLSIPSNELSALPLGAGQTSKLVAWTFAGDSGNEQTIAPILASSHVTASRLTRGPGLVDSGYPYSVIGASLAVYPAGNRYGQSLAASIAAQQYVQFTVAATRGHSLKLKALSFYPYFQNAGDSHARGAGITYSTDGVHFGQGLEAIGTAGTHPSLFTVDLSAQQSLRCVTGTIKVRVYLYGSQPYEFAGIGQHGDDDLFLTGAFE